MTRSFKSELPQAVRMRAETHGRQGVEWIESLDGKVSRLADAWEIEVGDVLSGGSESLVAEARTLDGKRAILKIGLPGSADLANEVRVYRLADGRGYAELLREDLADNAILLERLGTALGNSATSYESQIEIVCRSLNDAWIPLVDANGFMSGAEKAKWLADFIAEAWQALDRPCERRTIDVALGFTDARIEAHSHANCVLVHGDAHPHNLLMVEASENDPMPRYKFVDPDGLYAEKACDLAVPMRDGSAELLGGDTVALLRHRCRLIAGWTGVDDAAIWQWGFIERISTGLTLIRTGMKAEGDEMLSVADRLAVA